MSNTGKVLGGREVDGSGHGIVRSGTRRARPGQRSCNGIGGLMECIVKGGEGGKGRELRD